MRVLLITLHNVLNFGSALQTYASVHAMERLGHQVEVIDYWRPADKAARWVRAIVHDQTKHWPARVISLAYKALEHQWSRSLLQRFYRQHVSLTKPYRSPAELRADPPQGDAFVTGSDQVWNSLYNGGVDEALFLAFAPPGCRKIAYAASFGLDALQENEVEATARLVRQYDAISVRERSGLEILRQLGRDDACHVLDPTLLLNCDDWRRLASPLRPAEKYLLVYSVEGRRTTIAMKWATAIARARGLKIYQVTLGGFRQGVKGCDRVFTFATPGDFLSLILNAEYVVVSSFHGVAFSINLGKQFVSVAPNRFGGRAASLLQELGLEGRMVSDDIHLETALAPIDYTAVNERLDARRQRSTEYLKRALDGRMSVSCARAPFDPEDFGRHCPCVEST